MKKTPINDDDFRNMRGTKVSKEMEAEMDSDAGLQMVCLRLPSNVVEKIKTKAKEEGLKYQPYLRRLLIKMTETDSFEPSIVDFPKKLEDRIIQRVQKEFHLKRK
jgi:predicted DNA binding CopG/RHH family protein